MSHYRKISFLATEDQYQDLKDLLYDCLDNPFVESPVAEFTLKMLEENAEEYWAEEAFELSQGL